MFTYLSKIINSTNPNLFFLQLLLILAIVFVFTYLHRISEPPYSKKNKALEGFQQDHPYVLKQNHDIYDDFFAEMYDSVNNRNKICQRELFQIVKMTEPTTQNSIFLDVGSGTGCVVNELTTAGYYAYGVDKSKYMTDYAETLYPEITIKVADILDPMTYETGIFTHILCLNFTIYELDKKQFFNNCYYWMKSNAYLIVHLVDPNKFSTKKYLKFKGEFTSFYDSLFPESNNSERKTSITVDYNDCKYEEDYKFSNNSSNVTFKQTFTDKYSKNIRENEQILKMESIDEILDIAKRAGFIVQGKAEMKGINGDEHQYLYVFEKGI
jgi:SAM-dependent methyltransferase